MKKLKLGLSNFEGVEMLTRDQLKKVTGGDGGSGGSGGTCCWHTADNYYRVCGISKDLAIWSQQHYGGLWCCESC